MTILTFGKGSWPNDPDFRVCAATYSRCLLLNEVEVQHSSKLPKWLIFFLFLDSASATQLVRLRELKKNVQTQPASLSVIVANCTNICHRQRQFCSHPIGLYLHSNEIAAEFNVF